MGVVPAGLLPSRPRALAPVPPALPAEARRRLPVLLSAIMHISTVRERLPPIWRRCAKSNGWSTQKRPFGGPEAVLAYLARYTHFATFVLSRRSFARFRSRQWTLSGFRTSAYARLISRRACRQHVSLPAISCLGASRTPAVAARGWFPHPGVREICTTADSAPPRFHLTRISLVVSVLPT